MNKITKQLSSIKQLEDFNWITINGNNAYATAEMYPETIKDNNKNELILGVYYSLFVAHMYQGQPKRSFYYVLLYRKSKRRDYRKHSFYEIEYNKLYVSGKTIKDVVKKVREAFKKGYKLI